MFQLHALGNREMLDYHSGADETSASVGFQGRLLLQSSLLDVYY
jgi:hypothetical protein